MEVSPWRSTVCLISGCCALSFNLLLAYFILTVKCTYIGKYKWLLLLYTLSATLNSVAQVLTLAHLFMTSTGYIFYDSLRLLPAYVSDGVLIIFMSCFAQNLIILTICFIYRYYAVCEPTKVEGFVQKWPRTALISLVILATVMIALSHSATRSTRCEQQMDKEFINATGFSLTQTGYMAGLVYLKNGLNMKMMVVLWIYAILSLGAGITMVKLAMKIAKTLKHTTATSETILRHQKKIFTLLIVQLALPLLFNVCPQQIIVISLYFHFDTRQIVHLLCCFFTGAQVVDPLVTFYLIKPYRNALLENLFKIKPSNLRKILTNSVISP